MKPLRSRSLGVHITIVVLIASSIALAVFAVASIVIERKSSIAQHDAELSTLAEVVGQNSAAALSANDKAAGAEALLAVKRESQIVSACLYDSWGALFAEYRHWAGDDHCADRFNEWTGAGWGYRSVTRAAKRHGETLGTICLTSDMHDADVQEQRLLEILSVLALLCLGIGVLSGSILQNRVSQPITGLARAMHKVTSEESFDAEVSVSGSGEIAALASGFNTMIAELQRRERLAKLAEARLQRLVRTDSLTGLPNRRLFTECLAQAFSAARRNRRVLGLLYLDLDGFKLVNDSLGHSAGDMLLCEVASRFKLRVRESETLARVGGDEFTVILTDVHTPMEASRVADSLLDCMASPFMVDGHEVTLGASIGISTLDHTVQDGTELLRRADSAMYAAKRTGKNRVVHFSAELSMQARERLTLENQLRGAIGRGEIYVMYQPEFEVNTGRLIRFEALARWRHSQFGEIPPSRFIPIAEESGLIHALGAYVLMQACKEAANWRSMWASPVQVAVNASSLQFNSDRFFREVGDALRVTGLRPQLLQIELTESVMMGSYQRATEKLRKLSDMGVSLALDDFGTGYSCLSYLADLPFNSLKLDRSFITKLSPRVESNTMIRSMVDLAHSMNMRVIAEGIEQPHQLDMVKVLGVDEVQGYLTGRPGPSPSTQIKTIRQSRRPAVYSPAAVAM